MMDGELGTFLRSRREAVTPADVGLPAGERRRTPGLRRAELATLSGVSVEYLTRLEQGRDRRPSTQVVAAIADALRLDADDRRHLHELVAISHGTQLVCSARTCPDVADVPASAVAILDRLEPTPAYLVDRLGTLLDWTDGFARLAGPLGLLDEPANLLRYAFTDERARSAVADWAAFADDLVAWLYSHRGGDPRPQQLADELAEQAGPAFAERWARHRVATLHTSARAFVHPEVGLVRLTEQPMAVTDSLWLVVHLPADAAAELALDRLAGRRPGGLREASLA